MTTIESSETEFLSDGSARTNAYKSKYKQEKRKIVMKEKNAQVLKSLEKSFELSDYEDLEAGPSQPLAKVPKVILQRLENESFYNKKTALRSNSPSKSSSTSEQSPSPLTDKLNVETRRAFTNSDKSNAIFNKGYSINNDGNDHQNNDNEFGRYEFDDTESEQEDENKFGRYGFDDTESEQENQNNIENDNSQSNQHENIQNPSGNRIQNRNIQRAGKASKNSGRSSFVYNNDHRNNEDGNGNQNSSNEFGRHEFHDNNGVQEDEENNYEDHNIQNNQNDNIQNLPRNRIQNRNVPRGRLRSTKKIIDFISECIEFYKAKEGYGYEEKRKRYKPDRNNPDEIYLGKRITIEPLKWDLMLIQKPTIFLNNVAEILWNIDDLANRALDLSRVTENIPGRSPVQLIEKNLLRLLVSLFHDYLKKQANLNNIERALHLCKVTDILRTKIRNLRLSAKRASRRNVPNARRRLRYNNIE